MAALQPNTLKRASAIRSPLAPHLDAHHRALIQRSNFTGADVVAVERSRLAAAHGPAEDFVRVLHRPRAPSAPCAPVHQHRRHLPQPRDHVADLLRGVINLRRRRRAADPESQRRQRAILRQPQRHQHMRRFRLRARRARRHRDVVEAHQQRLAVNAGEADVQVARQPRRPSRRSPSSRRSSLASRSSNRSRSAATRFDFGRHFRARDLRRRAEPDDARHVQRARSHPALVAAAVDLRGDRHAARRALARLRAHTTRRRPSARRPCGRVIDAKSTSSASTSNGTLPDRLHRVGVKPRALRVRRRRQLP